MTKEMTIDQYISEITEMADVMGLAKQLKKMKLEEHIVEGLVYRATAKLSHVNPEDHKRYMNTVGCHSGIKEFYGCMEYKITCNHGGSISISDWIDVENSGSSLASIHTSNGWGLGGSNYINNLADIEKEIERAHQITWINSNEREFLINALENLKRGI